MMEGKIAQVKSRHFRDCACRVSEGQESLPLHKMGHRQYQTSQIGLISGKLYLQNDDR